MKVPFLELKEQHRRIHEELRSAIDRVIDSGWFALGPEVEAFEAAFAQFLGAKHCVAVNNGTSALHMALLALGVGPGDEVITVPHTFIATAEAVTAVGAKPVFVDVDSTSYTMDTRQAEAAITSRTRAIIPVHFCGQSADMQPLVDAASKKGIAVIEDACQAHGAEYQGRKAGTVGTMGCFSFYPSKNLGCMGEGGAVVTADPELARKIQMLRNHGSLGKFGHEMVGFNCRMESIQGAILGVKLKHLDKWNATRRALADRYNKNLAGANVTRPAEMSYGRHVYHLYLLQSNDRDHLRAALAERGIETGLHYPTPVHLENAYRSMGHREGSFPVSEGLSRTSLSLPIYPELDEKTVDVVSDAIKEITALAGAGR